ncbi:MAG: hypothetical protein BZY88_15380 [SAR202 cluster bacterium Io17-Chloro-G9]|nr:MAG: hypothetical protein BZY88_15380 [SAR202 cluster bacterium Io17-Chloro-G9]
MNQARKIVTAVQMTALEQASEARGVSTDQLMENAGLAVAQVARETMGAAAGARVVVLVGPGNNGADGLVAARHLRRWGAEVTACLLTRRPDFDPKLDLARQYSVSVIDAAGSPGFPELERLLKRGELVIDAVLGTGRARPLEGPVKQASQLLSGCRVAGSGPAVLALDLPTGVDPDTGVVDPACFTADLTVALAYPKLGLVTLPGAAHTGSLRVVDIGLPAGVEEGADLDLELLTRQWVASRLPARPPDSHKGTFGHALVVAGSRNYVGAGFLASQGAIRAGAGLVTLATPQSVYPMAATKLTEVIHLPLPEDKEGRVHPDGAQGLREGSGKYSAMLVGCGLGFSSGASGGTAGFVEKLLLDGSDLAQPVIIDADGLNNLAQHAEWWTRLRRPAVVTPHPGEMATLTGGATTTVQEDRLATVRHWAGRWNVAVVLKGAYTVVGDPQGLARIAPFANPGLASGGTGDVLSGIIAGLLAQGLSPMDAACCGVYLHGLAGEAVRRRIGDTGSIATDLVQVLPETIEQVRHPSGSKRTGDID